MATKCTVIVSEALSQDPIMPKPVNNTASSAGLVINSRETTEALYPQCTISRASTVVGKTLARASVIECPTEEKSLSD